jgi:hypothetical protein
LLRACLVLAAALVAPFPGFAGYGYWISGSSGILAALVALGICLFAGTLALVVTAVSQRMNQGVQGVFGAMLVRMSVPLVALFLLPKIGGPLNAAGVMGMLMAYYLITLAVETWLSLRFVPASKISGAKSPAAKVA